MTGSIITTHRECSTMLFNLDDVWAKQMKFALLTNPGSDEAIAQGCTCPVMDNAYGRGPFTVFDDCPIHGKQGADMPKEVYDANA